MALLVQLCLNPCFPVGGAEELLGQDPQPSSCNKHLPTELGLQ